MKYNISIRHSMMYVIKYRRQENDVYIFYVTEKLL